MNKDKEKMGDRSSEPPHKQTICCPGGKPMIPKGDLDDFIFEGESPALPSER